MKNQIINFYERSDIWNFY